MPASLPAGAEKDLPILVRFLASLMEDGRGEVLQAALPADIRATLPPAVRDFVEEAGQAEGKLEVIYADREADSRLLFFLQTARERLSLHFTASPPKHLQTGAQVRLKGIRIDGALALTSGATSIETLALDPRGTGTSTTATSGLLEHDPTGLPDNRRQINLA